MREYLGLVDAGSEYCVLPKVDAFRLGYPDVALIDTVVQAPNTTHFVTHLGFGKAPLIKMTEVALGPLTFGEVEFLAFDIPQACGFDVVFGRSLLRQIRFEVDFSKGLLKLGRGS